MKISQLQISTTKQYGTNTYKTNNSNTRENSEKHTELEKCCPLSPLIYKKQVLM